MGMVPFGAPAGGAAPPGYPPSAAPPAFGHHAGLGPALRPDQVKLPLMPSAQRDARTHCSSAVLCCCSSLSFFNSSGPTAAATAAAMC